MMERHDKKTIVILAEPRVGSTWLVSIFAAKGYGVPSDGEGELLNFNSSHIPQWATIQESTDWVHDGMDCVRINGRAVVKICYNQIKDIAKAFNGRLNYAQLLEVFFPFGEFIYLKRLDYISQIVSLFIARHTNCYSSFDRNNIMEDPEYSFKKILDFWKTIRPEAQLIFDPCIDLLRPLIITYEDMLLFSDTVSLKLSRFIGEPISININTPVKKQNSALKPHYVEQFRHDLETWLDTDESNIEGSTWGRL